MVTTRDVCMPVNQFAVLRIQLSLDLVGLSQLSALRFNAKAQSPHGKNLRNVPPKWNDSHIHYRAPGCGNPHCVNGLF